MTDLSKNAQFIALSNLHKYGSSAVDDDFTNNPAFQGTSLAVPALQEAINRKRAKAIEDAMSAAADEVLAAEKAAADSIENLRQHMRTLRARLNDEKSKIIRIAVARLYGQRTLNYIPLAVELNIVRPSREDLTANPIFTIPPTEAEALLREINSERAEAKTAKKK